MSNCPCSEKKSCPEIFPCIEYTFYIQESWATCACPDKQRVPWNFSLYWNIFCHSGFLSNKRCRGKQSCPENFQCMEYTFYIQNYWVTCACPEKQSLPWNLSLYSGFFLRRFRDPIRVPRIDNRVLKIGENYHRVPKIRENRVPRIREIGSPQVHTGYLTFSFKKTCCIEYVFFIIQDFWATCACPEK